MRTIVFLYVLSAIAALIIIVLCLFASVFIKYNSDGLYVTAGIGPVKIRLAPEKKKKVNIKKLAKNLRGKKLSQAESKKKKSKDTAPKNKKRTADLLKKIVIEEGEGSDGEQIFRFMLDFLKSAAIEFDKKLHIDIYRIYVGVDRGNAHSTAVTCGVLSQSLAYTLEIIDRHTVLKIKKHNPVWVVPAANNGTSVYDISLKVKMRIGSLIGHTLKLIFNLFRKKSVNN